ncbi:hypothetical protein Acr_05g0014880 [Actinidia rufa]|uniref:Uncharacterized protein n=1 Tax=Actinidia rufa TaxID=165716 RepID=A0A7J0EPC6_9ERIC|nr:hypothetical protein Acr_05g0014880 [Actinidia rufa]
MATEGLKYGGGAAMARRVEEWLVAGGEWRSGEVASVMRRGQDGLAMVRLVVVMRKVGNGLAMAGKVQEWLALVVVGGTAGGVLGDGSVGEVYLYE